MQVFQDYAKYYDLVYKDKDYASEVLYIDNLIKDHNPEAKTLLDIGCGTGRHAMEFASRGYGVTGIDSSEQMIRMALQKLDSGKYSVTPVFFHNDVRVLNLGRKYDAVVALFHVISYQATDTDLERAFNSVKKHMDDNSIFIFDIWYEPAVLNLKPVTRLNRYTMDNFKITRKSTPEWHIDQNIVDVNFHISITGPDEYSEEILETHRMRYFTISKLENKLNHCGLRMSGCYEWLTRNEPDNNNWSACILAELS